MDSLEGNIRELELWNQVLKKVDDAPPKLKEEIMTRMNDLVRTMGVLVKKETKK